MNECKNFNLFTGESSATHGEATHNEHQHCGRFTKSFVTDVDSTCSPKFKNENKEGRSPVNCFLTCEKSSNSGLTGMIWKKDSCGCIEASKLKKCQKSSNKDDYEYYESPPTTCGSYTTCRFTNIQHSIY